MLDLMWSCLGVGDCIQVDRLALQEFGIVHKTDLIMSPCSLCQDCSSVDVVNPFGTRCIPSLHVSSSLYFFPFTLYWDIVCCVPV